MSEGTENAPGPPGKAFWAACERARNSHGWTKTRLSKQAGIARKTYDRLETQPKKPLPETVNGLADALGIPRSAAARLAGLDPEAGPNPDTEGVASPTPASDAHIDEMLAKVPAWRRQRLERLRDGERERYDRQLQQAHDEYQRSLSHIEELLRWELGRDHEASPQGDGPRSEPPPPSDLPVSEP